MKKHLLSLIILIIFSPLCFGQYEGRFIELPKILKTNGTKSQAKIFIAPKSKDNDKLRNEFYDFESIKIDGLIEPASEDSGKQIDIFVVIRKQVGSKKTFYALDEDGIWALWNGSLKSLPVYKSIDSASDKHEFNAYSGGIESDEFNMYLGYSSETKDGKPIIHVNQTPYKITALKIKLNNLSLRETDFQLIEPDEWETNQSVYDDENKVFVSQDHNALTQEFPVLDIDHDGYDDLLIAGTVYDELKGGFVDKKVPLRWLKNLGDGTFEAGNQALLPETASRVLIRFQQTVDFNKDGLKDYIAAANGLDKWPWPGETNLLLFGKKEGGFTDKTNTELLFQDYVATTHALATGDINGDGFVDIATVDLQGPSTELEKIDRFVRVLINDGSGGFTLSSAFENNLETEATSATITDLNGDGLNDLILGGYKSEGVDKIYWNTGGQIDDSEYTELPIFSDTEGVVYDATMYILPSDVNGDGRLDLVVSKVTQAYDRYSLRFYENLGNKEFIDSTLSFSPWSDSEVLLTNMNEGKLPPYWLKEIDINLDGLLDIKLEYDRWGNEKTPHFWLKNKDGSYSQLENEVLPKHGWMWLVDYDNDRDLDIAVREHIWIRSEEYSNLLNQKFSWSILENLTIDKSEQ